MTHRHTSAEEGEIFRRSRLLVSIQLFGAGLFTAAWIGGAVGAGFHWWIVVVAIFCGLVSTDLFAQIGLYRIDDDGVRIWRYGVQRMRWVDVVFASTTGWEFEVRDRNGRQLRFGLGSYAEPESIALAIIARLPTSARGPR